MMRALKMVTSAVILAVFSTGGFAQQPSPPMVIVQAVGPTAAAVAPAPAAASSDSALAAAIKSLEQTKAANDALLKKQEAMLQQLDELQKAAEQLKVFTKRV